MLPGAEIKNVQNYFWDGIPITTLVADSMLVPLRLTNSRVVHAQIRVGILLAVSVENLKITKNRFIKLFWKNISRIKILFHEYSIILYWMPT